MTLRLAFALSFALAVALALALGAVAGIALWSADGAVRRIQGANGQLEALHDLDGAAGRYGRQVMNQLLFGYDRPGDLQTARNDMQRILSALTRATREELNVVSGREELQGQLPELERVRRITDLFFTIDRAAGQSFMLVERGERDAAMDVASRQVNFPLLNEMQPLIDQAISEERQEVGNKTRDLDALRTGIAVSGTGVAAVALMSIGLLALSATRRFRTQIDALTERLRASLQGQSTTAPRVTEELASLAGAVDEVASAVDAGRQRSSTAEAQLQVVDTERSQFLADVGHQLRTPLTVLRGEADVALRSSAGEASMRESMERVRAQAEELSLLLEDLMEAGRQDADLGSTVSRIDLRDVAASAAHEGKVLAEPREVEVVLERDKEPLEVAGDFRRLKQAITVGLDNAVKHSPPGSTIRISTTRRAELATVEIADEGPGISEEDEPNLFRRFYRGRQENDMLNTGFGIGLSIAKRIVVEHGGSVSLRNRTEGGALFTISLPCAEHGR